MTDGPGFVPEGRLDPGQSEAVVTRWWWVRHAPVTGAHRMRLSGQADIDADISDTAAFQALAPRLPKGGVWVLSNLARTHQTAEALWTAGADHPPEHLIEPAFAEQAFGDWTGLTWLEIGEADGGQDFWDAPATTTPPAKTNGLPAESFAQQCGRVQEGIADLTAAYAGRDIVCVAHAGTIRAAVALALGLTPEQALALDVKNLGLTRLDHIADGHWRVVALNQFC